MNWICNCLPADAVKIKRLRLDLVFGVSKATPGHKNEDMVGIYTKRTDLFRLRDVCVKELTGVERLPE